MNNFTAFLKLVYASFDDITEFESGEPQPIKDPMFGMWLNGLKNEHGNTLDLNDDEVKEFINLILEKRQTVEGIEELRTIVKERLSKLWVKRWQ